MVQVQPMAKQIDFYTLIHKALRRELFKGAIDIGRANFTDEEKVGELVNKIDFLISILQHHADCEERYFHPFLQKKVPDVLACLHAEHEAQEIVLKKIKSLTEALLKEENKVKRAQDGHHLYQTFNLFIKEYLGHLDQEEETMVLLWGCSTHEELKNVVDSFMAQADPRHLEESLAYIFPAIPKADSEEILEGIQRHAPAEAYERARNIAEETFKDIHL